MLRVTCLLALMLAACGSHGSHVNKCGEPQHEDKRPYRGFTNQLYHADFYPQSIVQEDGLRRAWMRITYMANVIDKQGDLTVHAHVGEVVHVFSEYDCQKRLVRVENLSPHGFTTMVGGGRASEFYTPVPGSVEEAAVDYFCRPVAPHYATSQLDDLWNGSRNPWSRPALSR